MTPDEYLEKIVTDAYKREGDQEENVARSLPFFATALGLLVTVLGVVKPAIPPLSWAVLPIITALCLAAIAASVLWVLYHLLQAVRPRPFRYVMREDELARYVEQMLGYHSAAGLTGGALDDAVLRDVRATLVEQYTEAVTHNREVNNSRLKARQFAVTGLVVGLGFAFLLIAAIFFHSDPKGTSNATADQGGTSSRPSAETAPNRQGTASEAGAAPNAHGDQGRMEVGRSHVEPLQPAATQPDTGQTIIPKPEAPME